MFSFEGSYLQGTGYAVLQEDESYRRFILTEDGRVFEDSSSGKVVVSDSAVVSSIEMLRDQDRETQDARNALARELAGKHGGSALALTLFASAIWYSGGDPGEGWVREEGVSFWEVGRNASHNFFMGLRKDEDRVRFFRGSLEPGWDEENKDVWDQREVSEFSGYYGHC
jgi:hypothetical protein